MNNKHKFTDDLLKAISNWQNGWSENQERRRLLADELVEQCEKLPSKFKTVKGCCFRKRFINEGEVVPIVLDNDFFEGIASWTEDKDYAKGFKGIIKYSSKFVMLFKQKPTPEEIVVNIASLWKDKRFIKAAADLKNRDENAVKALFHFRDIQSEVVLRSTLKGTEIEDIIGLSSSFEDICDMANILIEKRNELSIRAAQDPEGLPIEVETFAGSKATKKAIRATINKMKIKVEVAQAKNVHVDYSKVVKPHEGDLKHKLNKKQ